MSNHEGVPSPRPGRTWGRLLTVSAAAGLIVAAVVAPVVGGLGFAVKTGVHTFYSLPADLRVPPLPTRSVLVDRSGRPFAVFYAQDRLPVALRQVAPVMRKAIVAIEDSRFYQHQGVDPKGILRAAVQDLTSGRPQQGASTITQQYVKNVMMQQRSTRKGKQRVLEPHLSRKLREVRYAIALADKLSKDEVLQRYLNIVYFGDGAYGVGAAARHFFDVPASKLTLAQAALLAGLVQDPETDNPRLHPKVAKARRAVVLARMRDLGDITRQQYDDAVGTPLGLHVSGRQGQGCAGSWAPFYCDYVVQQLLADPALGETVQDRRQRLLEGGLTVFTALDRTTQRAAQRATRHVSPDSRVGSGIAMVVPGSGEVRALATNRRFGTGAGRTEVDYAVGGNAGFQAGSTFKVFLLAAALEKGVPLTWSTYAPQRYTSTKFGNYVPGQGRQPYVVGNAGDSEAGTFTVTQATWLSVNTFFVQLEEKVGVAPAVAVAKRLGVRPVTGSLQPVPSFFLGVNAVSPLDMAGAYAALAAHGVYCAPRAVLAVHDASGVVDRAAKSCRRAVPAKVADTVTSVLRGVIDGPAAHRTGAAASIGRPAAGKTGTTEGFGAAWFVGYTPQLAAGVWVGDPRGPSHPLRDVSLGGTFYRQVYGGGMPAQIWAAAMKGALAGEPVLPLAGPPPSQVSGAHGPAAPAPAPPPAPVNPAPQPGPGKKHHGHH